MTSTLLPFVPILVLGVIALLFYPRLSTKARFNISAIGVVVMVVLALTIAESKPFYASALCLIAVAGLFKNYLTLKGVSGAGN